MFFYKDICRGESELNIFSQNQVRTIVKNYMNQIRTKLNKKS